ncbi:MAG: BadF/BadG/BcrA/BcrD ATPase family protein [Tissierellia bacterium]|nr:BadF/BadG/BcrA/BcrD ATPase family protein [Tissierellia bacterium]
MFLGIDGGGTKTKFTLEDNGKYYSTQKNTIHLKQISDEKFYETIEEGVNEVCKQRSINPSDIEFTFAAIPGYGQYPEIVEVIENTFDKILGKDKYAVGNDCVNGWAGSLNAKEGINLVLGTGAISLGVDKNDKKLSASGWGPFLGDEASAYYIGMKILNLFTKMSDGRIEKTLLYDKIKNKYSIKEDFEIITIAANMKRDEIAKLSMLLQDLLDEDDKYAKEILEDVAYEASLAIDSLINQMDFTKPVKVSYSGGVFNLGDILLDKIKEKSKYELDIVSPYTTPDKGSIIMAKKIYSER